MRNWLLINEYVGDEDALSSFYIDLHKRCNNLLNFQHYVCDHVPGVMGSVIEYCFGPEHGPCLRVQFIRFIETCMQVHPCSLPDGPDVRFEHDQKPPGTAIGLWTVARDYREIMDRVI